jgi:RloB-like protein
MRRPQSYARRGPTREPYDYVLIVCEGSKTEPRYFQRLKEVFRLSNANIEIARPNATDPRSLVAFAETRLNERGFDRVYCVFDRDGHATYTSAVSHIIEQYGNSGRVRAITSVPCFEIWVLLHFHYTSAAFNACSDVLAEVKKHFADYTKGRQDIYDRLAGNMKQAIKHAVRLKKEGEDTRSSNPATLVHELVSYLCNLKK